MIGDARNLDEPSLFAALCESAAGRLRAAVDALWGTAQARLGWPAMMRRAPDAGTPMIPTVRYRDVPAAITWLCRAFGMQVHRVVADPDGTPCYAELTIGNGMLMVAPIEDTVFGKLMVQPDEIGGVETQVCYQCVANTRAHYARAKAAGAVIVIDPDDETNRGRGYSCRDPEGHVWNFGTYDPWRKPAPPPRAASVIARRLPQGVAALVLIGLAVALPLQLMPQPTARAGTAVSAPETRAPRDEPANDVGAAAVKNTAARPVELPSAVVEAAEGKAAEAQAQLAAARKALDKAERDAAAARAEKDELQRAKKGAEQAALEARASLAALQTAVERARQEAAQERAKRLALASVRARQPTIQAMRARARWPRTWCYHTAAPNLPANRDSRLDGFCR